MNQKILEVALTSAQAGGALLKEYFRSVPLEARVKTENDFVTKADRESEKVVLAEIRSRFPDHRILAEEAGWTGGESDEYSWVIDPLDGTTNFLQGLPIYGVSVACQREKNTVVAVVFDPEGENLFQAVRGEGAYWNGEPMKVSPLNGLKGAFLATGYPFRAKAALEIYLDTFQAIFLEARAIRRCGSAALDLAYTAAGVFDGFFEFRLSPWDIAAGALLIEEAGGVVSDLDGRDHYLESGNLIAGSPAVQQNLLEVVSRHVDEARLDALVPRPEVPALSPC